MAKAKLTNKVILRAYWIRKYREEKYSTAKEAALARGDTPSQWSSWENGSVEPFDTTMKELADFLGVKVEDFYREPENWEAEKREFLASLRRHSRKNKDRYVLPDTPSPTSSAKQSQAMDIDENMDIFLEIASLVNDARKQVKKGILSKATYDKNMKILADLIGLTNSHT